MSDDDVQQQESAMPMQIPPQPVPTMVSIGHNEDPLNPVIILVCSTPIGQSYYFIEANAALQIADQIKNIANRLTRGLVTPPKPRLVVPGQ